MKPNGVDTNLGLRATGDDARCRDPAPHPRPSPQAHSSRLAAPAPWAEGRRQDAPDSAVATRALRPHSASAHGPRPTVPAVLGSPPLSPAWRTPLLPTHRRPRGCRTARGTAARDTGAAGPAAEPLQPPSCRREHFRVAGDAGPSGEKRVRVGPRRRRGPSSRVPRAPPPRAARCQTAARCQITASAWDEAFTSPPAAGDTGRSPGPRKSHLRDREQRRANVGSWPLFTCGRICTFRDKNCCCALGTVRRFDDVTFLSD